MAAAPSALGATATVANGTLSYVAGPGEVNTVTITRTSTAFVISDPGRSIRLANNTTVTGTASFPLSGITSLLVDAGDSNDQVTISTSTRSTLYGGDGADSLIGNGSNDTL